MSLESVKWRLVGLEEISNLLYIGSLALKYPPRLAIGKPRKAPLSIDSWLDGTWP